MADQTPVTISESVLASSIGGSGTSGASPVPHDFLQNRAAIDLWDSDWNTGRYYWTVVGVRADGQDAMTPQEACSLHFRGEFRKTSVDPQLLENNTRRPYVTGLSPTGRLISAATNHTQFYGSPLVAWTASPAAAAYDVQWIRSQKQPKDWSSAGRLRTFATSAALPVGPGTWWYRVRGIDDSVPGNREMRWSAPNGVQVANPVFTVKG